MSLATVQSALNEAISMHKTGELQLAFNRYMDVIDEEPKNFMALHLAGIVLVQVAHFEKALHLLDRALAIKPNDFEVQYNRANALCGLNKHKEALTGYGKALEINPYSALAFLGQGNVLEAMMQPEHALASYDCAAKLMPDYELIHFNRGNILEQLEKYTEAADAYKHAIKIKPDYAQAHHNLANVFALQRNYFAAKKTYKDAIEISQDPSDSLVNLGNTLMELQEYEDALNTFEQSLSIKPDNANAHYSLSHCLLQVGQFEKAWKEYAWRWNTKGYTNKRQLKSALPNWDKSNSSGHLLIWAEQGIGDEIFWGKHLNFAKRINAKITAQVDSRLVSIFNKAYPDIKFIAHDVQLNFSEYDTQIAMGDLGLMLEIDSKYLTLNSVNYLKSNPENRIKIRNQIKLANKKICGISWKSINVEFGDKKSMRLEDMLPILKNEDYIFVNLQYGDVQEELNRMKSLHGIDIKQCEKIDLFADINGLLDLVDACDIVVTTSNTTAHLAGALNKETYTLLPFGRGRIWYWLNETDGKSTWYPSVNLRGLNSINEQWNELTSRVSLEF
jgi:tetratricopeptide (TPR) repeat protein